MTRSGIAHMSGLTLEQLALRSLSCEAAQPAACLHLLHIQRGDTVVSAQTAINEDKRRMLCNADASSASNRRRL